MMVAKKKKKSTDVCEPQQQIKIKSRLDLGNACDHSVQNLLLSHLLL
jgi:hypothetical protein